MAIFKNALKKALKNEGGYVDNKKDMGGETKYGISIRFLQSIDSTANKQTIENLTLDMAEDIYFKYFWLENNYQEISSQQVAEKVFDTAVNMGSRVANRFLQQAINIVILSDDKLKEDGIIGSKTINTLNMLNEEDADSNILKIYELLQKEYYSKIIINRPEQIVFLKGWFNRASGE